MLEGKTMLITGGTGSFGKNFVNFLLEYSNLNKIVIFSRDEWKQFQMQDNLQDNRLRFFLGDVRDLPRLEKAFCGVDIVIHAAALKQVPALEYNPFEAIKTNVLGTQNVIDAAIKNGVKKTLLISTDKAAQPVNLYGSTKLCAEKLFIAGNAYIPANNGAFSCVRYGNVIGSRGSIVETLLKRKKEGAEVVNITDENMTRFWITLEQSFKLVLFALENMQGGEIFIPKAPSMRLCDLFDSIIPEAKRTVIGIRPGEKLHEILLTKDEARHSLDLNNYFAILPEHKEIFDIVKRFEHILSQGKKLPKNFSFESYTNKNWLTKDELKKILKLNN